MDDEIIRPRMGKNEREKQEETRRPAVDSRVKARRDLHSARLAASGQAKQKSEQGNREERRIELSRTRTYANASVHACLVAKQSVRVIFKYSCSLVCLNIDSIVLRSTVEIEIEESLDEKMINMYVSTP